MTNIPDPTLVPIIGEITGDGDVKLYGQGTPRDMKEAFGEHPDPENPWRGKYRKRKR